MRAPKSPSHGQPGTPITLEPKHAERFDRVLGETIEAMDEAGISYSFIGGIASGGLGRPRSTQDIDLFVTPDDAEIALASLGQRGFRTEKTDHTWLYKAFKDDVLVDVIFKSKGEIYFDPEMNQRLITHEFHGKRVKLVAPEDLLVIKAAASSELTPNHWYDAIGLLSRANIDWDYLLRRARRAPRRILSVLLFAQSNDVWVPNRVIQELFADVFGTTIAPARKREPRQGREHPRPSRHYAVAQLRERLAADSRTNDLDIRIEQSGNRVVLKGEVVDRERCCEIERIARDCVPELEVENRIQVLRVSEAGDTEEVA